jgi:integrase
VRQVPHFPITSVDNARQGVMEHNVYRHVRDLLPPYARIALVVGYRTGARKGEIRGIRVNDVDFAAGRIAVRKKATVQKGGMRYLPIYGDMAAELSMAVSLAQAAKCQYIVQDDGKQVFDFEKAWKTACRLARAPQALFHDLRRTALTNMIGAGFSEKEAMEISGHKTRAVFDRYHIVSTKRIKELSRKMESFAAVQDTGARQDGNIQ